jgi:queuosine precursor transporter
VTIATLLGVPGFIPALWLPLVVTNYLFKCGVEIALTPVTYWVVGALKRREGVDVYDRGTNFNPFKWEVGEEASSASAGPRT